MTCEITLASLAPRPIWVAWQTQDRRNKKGENKPTKVPFDPGGQREAKANDATTWGTRNEAEARARKLPKPYNDGGVGIEFAPIDHGLSLWGIDLDTCRDKETGELAGWAEDFIASLDSYVEVSPSGTGVKAFATYDTDAIADLRKHMKGADWGKKWCDSSETDHPPGIEAYLGGRFFTVTDHILVGSRQDLRHIPSISIIGLFTRAATVFAKPDAAKRGEKASSADRSRSSAAFCIGKRFVADGATFEQMCDGLRTDPDTAEWMQEKGEAYDFREARRIFEKAKASGPLIRVVAGDLHLNATSGEAAIIEARLPIFQRGNNLVRPVVQEVPAARGKMTVSAALHEIGAHGLVDALCGCATWERFDARAEDWQRINPPKQVAEIILSRAGAWTLPKIVGVVTCPTLRPDGSILSAHGYDVATRLYHAADPALVLAEAVQKPTHDLARKALAVLRGLLAEFPFADAAEPEKPSVSQSVALSGLITPVVRGALSVAPLHAFRANTAGTGKSYLVDIASAISTGRPCPVASVAADEAETEKRIAGLLLAGFPIASLDNCNGILGGDTLCQAIERPLVRIRRLGGSDIIEIESRATMFATGNALQVRGDMVRRTLICDLDAGVERPELRTFQGDPVAAVMANRGRYVSACLIIVRAYLAAGSPDLLPPIASFADWSNIVRSALCWLGCPDAASSMEVAREDDPDLAEIREVMAAWLTCVTVGQQRTAQDLADLAEQRVQDSHGKSTAYPQHREWSDCLARLVGERGGSSTRKLGNWLRKHQGRVVEGKRFIKAKEQAHGGAALWSIQPSR